MSNNKLPVILKIFIFIQFLLLFTITAPFEQSTLIRAFILMIDLLIVCSSVLLGYIKKISKYYIFILLYCCYLSIFYLYRPYNEPKEIIIIFIIIVKFLFFNSILNKNVLNFIYRIISLFTVTNLILAILEISLQTNFFSILFSEKYLLEISILNSRSVFYPRTSFQHTLILSFVLIITIPFLFILKNKLITWTAVSLQLLMLFFLEKRTGMVLSIIAIFLYLSLDFISSKSIKLKNKKIFYIFVIIFLMTIGINFVEIGNESLFAIIVSKFADLGSQGSSLSLTHRMKSLSTGARVFYNTSILEFLIGNGFSFLINYYTKYGIQISVQNFIVVDNSYLTYLTNFGLLNSLFTISWIIYLMFKNILLLKHIDESMTKYLIVTLTVSSMFFVDIFFFDFLGWYPALVMGILMLSILNRRDIYEIEEGLVLTN